MFMVLSSWYCHCESSPGSFDECSTQRPVAANLLDLADQPEATDPLIGSCSDYIHCHHLLLCSSKADTHFTIPRRVEG